jgi:hypothetical protein
MKKIKLCLVTILALSVSELNAQDPTDHSPHAVKFVTVGAARAGRSSSSPALEIPRIASMALLRSSTGNIMSTASPGKGQEHPASLHPRMATIQQTTLVMTYLP